MQQRHRIRAAGNRHQDMNAIRKMGKTKPLFE
jgi:hypothetical protein